MQPHAPDQLIHHGLAVEHGVALHQRHVVKIVLHQFSHMRDGSLICVGKGNEAEMEGIYSTSVSRDTLDECPMAYKGMEDIVNNIGPSAEILSVIRAIYNFKAGDEDA